MPLEKRTHSNGAEPWSPFRSSRNKDNAPSTRTPPSVSDSVANVEIVVGAWTSDNALYEDAPIHGTIYYADVPHNLRSEDAYPVTYRLHGDASRQNAGAILDRQFVNINTVRIWLKTIPSGTIVVKVLR